jgi:excinuclease UvrABC nuclease subunit
MSDIKKIIKDFPKASGVYQFFDKEGRLLYVGKAKNLKSRVKSYFAKEIGRGPTIDLMVKEAVDIKYHETESEIEAILLEADLINKLKPKYNVRLRDDKSFLVIKITKKITKSKLQISNKKSNSKIQIYKTDSGLFSCVGQVGLVFWSVSIRTSSEKDAFLLAENFSIQRLFGNQIQHIQ